MSAAITVRVLRDYLTEMIELDQANADLPVRFLDEITDACIDRTENEGRALVLSTYRGSPQPAKEEG